MSSHNVSALLLDLDGTMADTLPHLFAAFRYAVKPYVKRLPRDEEILATFGPAERECIRRLLVNPALGGEEGAAGLEAAHQRFHAKYEGGHAEGVRSFPGIPELLRDVRGLGWRIGVFTGKGRRSAVFTLERLGLRVFADVVVTSDEVLRPKPDPEGVLKSAAELGVPPARLVFVGDTAADVRAGRAAGAATVAALWGAADRSALLAAAPDWAFETVADLHAAIIGAVVRIPGSSP